MVEGEPYHDVGGADPDAINHFRADYLGKGDLRETGFGGTDQEWEQCRKIIVDALDSDGAFLDLGCANARLASDLQKWAGEKGINLDVFGADFVPELVDKARQRFPEQADHFNVADVSTYDPGRSFKYIRMELCYFPEDTLRDHILRYVDMLEPGGKLIITKYDNNTGHEFQEFADKVQELKLGDVDLRYNEATCLAIVRSRS